MQRRYPAGVAANRVLICPRQTEGQVPAKPDPVPLRLIGNRGRMSELRIPRLQRSFGGRVRARRRVIPQRIQVPDAYRLLVREKVEWPDKIESKNATGRTGLYV